MKVFDNLSELRGHLGQHLGFSSWHEVTQDEIDLFAEATGDRQWIHIDPEKAALGPFGATIAHGYMTLALAPKLVAEVYRVDGVQMAVNYGSNKVRFPSPVLVGTKIRAGAELLKVEDTAKGVYVTARVTIEKQGADKPACVAETVALIVI